MSQHGPKASAEKFIEEKVKEMCSHFGAGDMEDLISKICNTIIDTLNDNYLMKFKWERGSVENIHKANRQSVGYGYNRNFGYVQERLLDICNYFDINMSVSMQDIGDDILAAIETELFLNKETKVKIKTIDNGIEEVDWGSLSVLNKSYVDILNNINLRDGDVLEDALVKYGGIFVQAKNRYVGMGVYGGIEAYNYMKNEQCLKLFNMLVSSAHDEYLSFDDIDGLRYITAERAVRELFKKSGRLLSILFLSGKLDDTDAKKIVYDILYKASEDYAGVDLGKELPLVRNMGIDMVEGGAYENDIKAYMAEGSDFPKAYALSYMDYHTYFINKKVDFMSSGYFDRIGIKVMTGYGPVWQMMRNYAKAKVAGLKVQEYDVRIIEDRVRKILGE